MKTTVDIADDLLRNAKRSAIDRGCTLRELIDRGLRREIEGGAPSPLPPVHWVTVPGGLPEGVDPDDRQTLYAWLNRDEKP